MRILSLKVISKTIAKDILTGVNFSFYDFEGVNRPNNEDFGSSVDGCWIEI